MVETITGKAAGHHTGEVTFQGEGGEALTLTGLVPVDQGGYHCRDQDGREWLFTDYEDEAMLTTWKEE